MGHIDCKLLQSFLIFPFRYRDRINSVPVLINNFKAQKQVLHFLLSLTSVKFKFNISAPSRQILPARRDFLAVFPENALNLLQLKPESAIFFTDNAPRGQDALSRPARSRRSLRNRPSYPSHDVPGHGSGTSTSLAGCRASRRSLKFRREEC